MHFSQAHNKELHLTRLGAIPAVILALIITLMIIFRFSEPYIFNPPNLLLVLNIIFLTGTSIVVSLMSTKSYLENGSINILLLGTAVLLSGIIASLSGWAGNISLNYNASIYNIGLLFSSGLQLATAIIIVRGISVKTPLNRKASLLAIYVGVLVFCLVLVSLVFDGLTPAFYTSKGPTLLRQAVVETSIFFLALSCIIFLFQYSKSKSKFSFGIP